MWGALKHDLLDFISTIKDDTTKGIHKVLGDSTVEEKSQEEKMITDVSRSFTTYSTPIEPKFQIKYDRFMKKYSLSSYASEVAELLDREIDVPRFYADLVPSQLQPEEFWSRYFFRVAQIRQQFGIGSGGFSHGDEGEEEEEELTWDESSSASNADATTTSHDGSTATAAILTSAVKNVNTSVKSVIVDHTADQLNSQPQQQQLLLQKENAKLKAQIKTLTNRIAELEQQLSKSSTSYNKITTTAAATSMDISNDNLPVLPTGVSQSLPLTASAILSPSLNTSNVETAAIDSENVSEGDDTTGSGGVSGRSVGGSAVIVSKPSTAVNHGRSNDDERVMHAPNTLLSSAIITKSIISSTPTAASTTVAGTFHDDVEEDESWD